MDTDPPDPKTQDLSSKLKIKAKHVEGIILSIIPINNSSIIRLRERNGKEVVFYFPYQMLPMLPFEKGYYVRAQIFESNNNGDIKRLARTIRHLEGENNNTVVGIYSAEY